MIDWLIDWLAGWLVHAFSVKNIKKTVCGVDVGTIRDHPAELKTNELFAAVLIWRVDATGHSVDFSGPATVSVCKRAAAVDGIPTIAWRRARRGRHVNNALKRRRLCVTDTRRPTTWPEEHIFPYTPRRMRPPEPRGSWQAGHRSRLFIFPLSSSFIAPSPVLFSFPSGRLPLTSAVSNGDPFFPMCFLLTCYYAGIRYLFSHFLLFIFSFFLHCGFRYCFPSGQARWTISPCVYYLLTYFRYPVAEVFSVRTQMLTD